MSQIITISEKKKFLQWFLSKYELKKRECAWLLTYLMSDDELIDKVRFVDETNSDDIRSMFMSTKCVRGNAFRFIKGKLTTSDVERAFHDIRLHPEEEILITLSFHQSESCYEYAAVREVDPMERYNVTSNSWYSLLAEMVLDEAIERFQKERLYQQINQSLEDKDKESFLRLSRRWTELHTEE
ncbi:ReoY family proteolytic degradation factor [Caldalkalibacillus mannanilyticus]|uniref:ReoY family proteolytic degradation factor n=1 Tax=Caldalkalibacillus mannanilyticus TaxID=1418 RepID=UPI00046A6CA8|nr:ReoY family proteolytic degradation factor [Caldalkalibacillus mannanilyticus]